MSHFRTAAALSHQILATTFHFFILEAPSSFIFQPGQYISVKVAPNRINCYSIAGHDTPNRFSLLVDILPQGPGSKFFESLKAGEYIKFLGPFGNFVLHPDDGAKVLLFLATGCGFAPLKTMIESLLNQGVTLPVFLYLSFRSSKDVFWEDYFQTLSHRFANFRYSVSVDQADKDWRGNVGFITKLLDKDFPSAEDCAAYLCGNKYMINDASKLLTDRGLPKERIYTEKL